MLPAIFNNQPIRKVLIDDEHAWFSLTDCAKINNYRLKLSEILASAGYKAYREAIVGFSTFDNKDEAYIALDKNILSLKGAKNSTNELGSGTWVNIANQQGQLQLLYFAQIINSAFHVWCNTYLQKLIFGDKAKLQAKLDKTQAKLHSTQKSARRDALQVAKLSARLTDYESGKICTEAQPSAKLHELYAIVGLNLQKEVPFKIGKNIIRFDAYRETYKTVTIYEYKLGPIVYETAGAELFGDKQYFKKCKELWPTKKVKFWLISPIVDELGIQKYAEHMAGLFGEKFELIPCQLDGKYFIWLKKQFVKICLAKGLTHDEAYRQWEQSGADAIVDELMLAQH